MTAKQQVAAEILSRLQVRVIDTSEAAALLGLTPRQVRRLRARFQQEGFAWLVVVRVPYCHECPRQETHSLPLTATVVHRT